MNDTDNQYSFEWGAGLDAVLWATNIPFKKDVETLLAG